MTIGLISFEIEYLKQNEIIAIKKNLSFLTKWIFGFLVDYFNG